MVPRFPSQGADRLLPICPALGTQPASVVDAYCDDGAG